MYQMLGDDGYDMVGGAGAPTQQTDISGNPQLLLLQGSKYAKKVSKICFDK